MKLLVFIYTPGISNRNHIRPLHGNTLLLSLALYRLTFWTFLSAYSCSVISFFHGKTERRLSRLYPEEVLHPKQMSSFALRLSNSEELDQDDDDESCGSTGEVKQKKILALSGSSSSNSTMTSNKFSDGNAASNFGFVASEKFELQYTCKVCDHRNANKISRKAYREGVVIAVCKGCNSKHLIADNLGWTKFAGGFTDGETNIEEFLEARGEKVTKVSKDVWELEKLFYTKKTKDGEIDTQ